MADPVPSDDSPELLYYYYGLHSRPALLAASAIADIPRYVGHPINQGVWTIDANHSLVPVWEDSVAPSIMHAVDEAIPPRAQCTIDAIRLGSEEGGKRTVIWLGLAEGCIDQETAQDLVDKCVKICEREGVVNYCVEIKAVKPQIQSGHGMDMTEGRLESEVQDQMGMEGVEAEEGVETVERQEDEGAVSTEKTDIATAHEIRSPAKLIEPDTVDLINDAAQYASDFTAPLGIPISCSQCPESVGTAGAFFEIEGHDHLFILTAKHVVSPKPERYTEDRTSDTDSPVNNVFIHNKITLDNYFRAIEDDITATSNAVGNRRSKVDALLRAASPDAKYIGRLVKEIDDLSARSVSLRAWVDRLKREFGVQPAKLGEVFRAPPVTYSCKISTQQEDALGCTEDWALIKTSIPKSDCPPHINTLHFVTLSEQILSTSHSETPPRPQALGKPAENVEPMIHPPKFEPLLPAGNTEYLPLSRAPFTRADCLKGDIAVFMRGATSGLTMGSTNSLYSFQRDRSGHWSKELPVVGMGGKQFSTGGDFGAAVVARDGRLVGLVTGGGGLVRDVTFVTPMYWLVQRWKDLDISIDLALSHLVSS